MRRVLPLIVVVCLIGALGTVFYLRTIKEPPPTPDELWPEQGDVIATIDGKEYRYDQVYLFRLTGYWFPENYRESTLDPEHPIEALGESLQDNTILLIIKMMLVMGSFGEIPGRKMPSAWNFYIKKESLGMKTAP